MLILNCLSQNVDRTTRRWLGYLAEGLLAMTGRMTMLGLSRWTERGESCQFAPLWSQRICGVMEPGDLHRNGASGFAV
jgi:hypothetical protein